MNQNEQQCIGIISDTHGYLNPIVFDIFQNADLIIHAGDIGNTDVLLSLQACAPVKAVYGNMDGFAVRKNLPQIQRFDLLKYHFTLTHIQTKIQVNNADWHVHIFGHTHKAKVSRDRKSIVINPGSASRPLKDDSATVVLLDIQDEQEPEIKIVRLVSEK